MASDDEETREAASAEEPKADAQEEAGHDYSDECVAAAVALGDRAGDH
jgi:hypothetical protein